MTASTGSVDLAVSEQARHAAELECCDLRARVASLTAERDEARRERDNALLACDIAENERHALAAQVETVRAAIAESDADRLSMPDTLWRIYRAVAPQGGQR